MSSTVSSRSQPVTPSQVWTTLPGELRHRTVGLLAQLALHAVASHFPLADSAKEAPRADPTKHPQNPS